MDGMWVNWVIAAVWKHAALHKSEYEWTKIWIKWKRAAKVSNDSPNPRRDLTFDLTQLSTLWDVVYDVSRVLAWDIHKMSRHDKCEETLL